MTSLHCNVPETQRERGERQQKKKNKTTKEGMLVLKNKKRQMENGVKDIMKMQYTHISHLHTADSDQHIWMRNKGLMEMRKGKKRKEI